MPTQTLEPSAKNHTQHDEHMMKQRKPNRGNFANDPERAREAGRKGGKARGRSHIQ